VEEIRRISGGALEIDLEYDSINTFLAGQITVGIDDTVQDYLRKLDKAKAAKQLEAKKKRTKEGRNSGN